MSIRLRLTLLYSGILALTLIVFSTVLYITQSQVTLGTIKSDLVQQAATLIDSRDRLSRHLITPPPNPEASRSEVPALGLLRGRWMQTRSPDGTVAAETPDLAGAALPLSPAGLAALQDGADWFESGQVQSQPVLVYSAPLTSQDRVIGIVQAAAPLAERNQSLNTLRWILIVGSGLVILAAFLSGWVLAGTALDPIQRITRVAQAIGAERNFGRRVEHFGPNDEVGQLAVTFNSMLNELESAFDQLRQGLDSQRRFAADASHELRTPLTTVRGNIELLSREPPMDAQERADVLVDTKGEVERLIRLVNRLLVLARSDAGQPLRHEWIPVQPLLEEVCRQTRLRAPRRTITCDISIDAAVRGDRDALKQVFVILLDNAVVHTSPHAAISLAAQTADGRVLTCVQDTGTGIAPHILPHIFDRFYRGDVSRTGTSTGLGLSIAQELVQAHGGTITVESRVGQGTVFRVSLPQAAE